jgi:hypothetical protein
MMHTQWLRRAVLGMVVLTQAACYDYLAVPSGQPAPAAMAVRVQLAPSGTARVVPALGPFIVSLDGTLDGPWPSDSLRVRVFATRHETGFRTDYAAGLPVTVAASDVQEARMRKLNPLKTGMLVVALGVGLGSMPALIQRSGGGGGTVVGPPPAQP